jgi:hypothetical protein
VAVFQQAAGNLSGVNAAPAFYRSGINGCKKCDFHKRALMMKRLFPY